MKRRKTSVGCVAWLLCSGLALAEWRHQDVTMPDSEWAKSKNGFSAMMLLSDAPDDVLRTWATPAATVPVQTADTIPRGAPIVAFVFFAGCLPDDYGLCNATADFTILRPDGSVYESFHNRDLWKRKPAPPRGMLRLAAEYVGAVIESGDPLGEYEVRVAVHDLNNYTTLTLRQTFTATEANQ